MPVIIELELVPISSLEGMMCNCVFFLLSSVDSLLGTFVTLFSSPSVTLATGGVFYLFVDLVIVTIG